MGWLSSVPINLSTKGLDGLWTCQQATSGNLANWETLGYKNREVSPEERLQKSSSPQSSQKRSEQLQATNSMQPQVMVPQALSQWMGDNSMDVEQQNTKLTRTQTNYVYSLREFSDYFSRLRYVIADDKGQ